LFRWNGKQWQEKSLLMSPGITADNFGCSVSVSADMALVGASFANDNGTKAGSTFLYELEQIELPPDMALSPAQLSLTVAKGTNTSQMLTITNNDRESLQWTLSKNADWLNVTPTSGTVAADNSQTLTITIDATNLTAGTYRDTLTISAPDSPTVKVPVWLTVTSHTIYLPLISR
jgi:hypothetical protein